MNGKSDSVHYFEDYPIMCPVSTTSGDHCSGDNRCTFISNSSLFVDTYCVHLPITLNRFAWICARLGQMRNVKMIAVIWFVPKSMQTVWVCVREIDEWIAKFMHINSIRVHQQIVSFAMLHKDCHNVIICRPCPLRIPTPHTPASHTQFKSILISCDIISFCSQFTIGISISMIFAYIHCLMIQSSKMFIITYKMFSYTYFMCMNAPTVLCKSSKQQSNDQHTITHSHTRSPRSYCAQW